MRLSISTIILNWNRAALLDDCIRSFVETCQDYDLCIAIDNASTDESSQVIERWCTRDPRIRGMLQPENRGAEWINDAMACITSDLVLILANDKRLLPGWLDYARRVFAAFPEIGQLALHAPAPLDDEVWVTKPAIYRYRGGVGIYEAVRNTGMSSVLRRCIFAPGSIAFHNLDDRGDVKLPADDRLSTEVKRAGLCVAWSERYYCLNVGHSLDQFVKERDYYEKNYAAKPGLGLNGLNRRITEHLATPKPARSSRLFQWEGIPECHLRSGLDSERLWSILDGGGAELEAMEFAYGFVRLVKPRMTFLVRGWSGYLAAALAQGLADNGFGRLRCVEPELDLRDAAQRLWAEQKVADVIAVDEHAGDPQPELMIIAGYFDEPDCDWVLAAARSAGDSCRYALVQESALTETLAHGVRLILAEDWWAAAPLDTPRRLTLYTRRGNSDGGRAPPDRALADGG